jgi:hypothetical protein
VRHGRAQTIARTALRRTPLQGDETRAVLKFTPLVAPVKATVRSGRLGRGARPPPVVSSCSTSRAACQGPAWVLTEVPFPCAFTLPPPGCHRHQVFPLVQKEQLNAVAAKISARWAGIRDPGAPG